MDRNKEFEKWALVEYVDSTHYPLMYNHIGYILESDLKYEIKEKSNSTSESFTITETITTESTWKEIENYVKSTYKQFSIMNDGTRIEINLENGFQVIFVKLENSNVLYSMSIAPKSNDIGD